MEKVKTFIGLGLGLFLILLSWVAVELGLLVRDGRQLLNKNTLAITSTVNNLKVASEKLPGATEDLSAIASKGKDFTTIVASADRAKEVANYLDVLNFNTQVAQNDIRQAIAESKQTSIMLRKQAEPILISANELVKEGTATIGELRHQIKQNGDEIKELLAGTRSLVAHSEGELIATLQNINKTSQGVQLLINDPALKQSIDSVAGNLTNIQIITKEFADLSTHLIEPIVRPEKPKGLKKFTQPLFKIFRALTAGGQILLIIERLGG